MTAWRVRLSSTAAKAFRRLDRDTQERLGDKFDELAADPLTASKPLTGSDMRSARVGGWRLLLDLDRDTGLVIVQTIAPRGQVYRRLQ